MGKTEAYGCMCYLSRIPEHTTHSIEDMDLLSSTEESQKFMSSLLARSHASKHTASGRDAVDLLHTPHRHAQVCRLHDHTYALRQQHIVNSLSNLLCQSLLNLESSREHLSQSRQFRKAKDSAIGDIADVHLFHPSGQYCISGNI